MADEKQFLVEIVQGVVHRHTTVPESDIVAGVVGAIAQLREYHHGFRIEVSEYAGQPIPREADQPHEFESLRGAPEGGLGECAICGYARSAPIHSPLPAYDAIMGAVFRGN